MNEQNSTDEKKTPAALPPAHACQLWDGGRPMSHRASTANSTLGIVRDLRLRGGRQGSVNSDKNTGGNV